MKKLFALLLLINAAHAADNRYPAVAPNVGFPAVSELTFRESDHKLAYGSDALQFGRLWLPESGQSPRALLIFIHGGCWSNQFFMDHSYAFSTGLADAGYAVWSLEYRRTGDAGGGWPGSFEDVVAGINAVSRLEDFGVDNEKLAIMGHSAGGHLALLAGSDQGGLKLEPQLVVGLAAISDIASYSKGSSSCETGTLAFMGGSIEEKFGSYLSANPANHSLHPNSFLLHGDQDEIVPLVQASLAGARTRIAEDASHFDWIHPGTPAFADLLELLDETF